MADDHKSIVQAVAEITKNTPIYQDAIQPVAKEVGKSLKTLGGVLNMALYPLEAMVFGFSLIKVDLSKKLERRLLGVDPDKIISPPLQVVGPLIERYRFVHDNSELSEMFINLLATSMNKDTVEKAHPSFIPIISELSPDEARLIKAIKNT